MKIVCKNKKNYLKVLISFFLSVVVFCSLALPVLGATTTISVSVDSLFFEEGITYYNSNYKSYIVYYTSVNKVRVSYSAGAHYYRFNGDYTVACASDGTYLPSVHLEFEDLSSAVDFITSFDSSDYPDNTLIFTRYSAEFPCDWSNIVYNNKKIYSTKLPNEDKILKDVDELEGDSSGSEGSEGSGGSVEDSTILDLILEGIKSIPEKIEWFFENLGIQFERGLLHIKAWFTFSDDFSQKLTDACSTTIRDNETVSDLFDFFTDLKDFFADATRQTYLNSGFEYNYVHEIDYWIGENSLAHPEKYIGDETSFKLDFKYITPYMQRIRSILSVFIWIGFLYRVWFRLPSILQGIGGDEAITDIIVPDIATKVKNRKAKKQQKTSNKGGK